jgi:hypothetical protein
MVGDENGDENGHGDADSEGSRLDRRAFGTKVAVGAAAAWIAPAIISVKAAEAATCVPIPATPPVLTGTNIAFITDPIAASGPNHETSAIRNSSAVSVWAETGPVVLLNAITVSGLGSAGTYTPPSIATTESGTTIPAGTIVYSYFLQARTLLTLAGQTNDWTGSLNIPAGLQVAGFAATSTTTGQITANFPPVGTNRIGTLNGTHDFEVAGLKYGYLGTASPGNLNGMESGSVGGLPTHTDTLTLSAATVSWSLQTAFAAVPVIGTPIGNTSDQIRLFLTPSATNPCAPAATLDESPPDPNPEPVEDQ